MVELVSERYEGGVEELESMLVLFVLVLFGEMVVLEEVAR